MNKEEYIVLCPVNNNLEKEKLKRVHQMRQLAVKNNYPVYRERLSRDTYLYSIPDLNFKYKEDYA